MTSIAFRNSKDGLEERSIDVGRVVHTHTYTLIELRSYQSGGYSKTSTRTNVKIE